ncbi:hypothetical protein [Streptacidiphilus monticola]|uniref:ScoMcrA-like SRA domain-containing protein n=1 Tax=Streptacidiphilus monticola TaxID=2161674 RepID=A0ABW1G775_9ACTN
MPTFELELVPGLLTTRRDVAQSFGGATFGGIEPAVESKMVLVYSDPSAGEAHGYTFDGQAEDDERGPLYYYTGEGPKGDQQLTGGNASLRWHKEADRTVHLFVADGWAPHPVTGRRTGTRQQRYIGQMVVDDLEPFERRTAAGADGELRQVIVFRLRPDPAADYPPLFKAQDAVHPATVTQAVEVDVTEPELSDEPEDGAGGSVPVQPGAVEVETEAHTTDETTANIPGGLRTIRRREAQLVAAYKAHLQELGHTVRAHQITVAGVRGPLRTDLYDVTDNVLYEAKGTARRSDVRMAIGQLRDYRRHINAPDDLRLAILLPGDPGDDLRDLLGSEEITLVIRTAGGFERFEPPQN